MQNIVYGVTATPFREDRLDKINTMLLGPIRYKYTAMDRAQEQGIAHLVYPRFTRTVIPRLQKESRNINEAYELLRKLRDGRWSAFEIKLGANQIEKAAKNLLKVKEAFEKDPRGKAPDVICVVCGMVNAAYQKTDGVYVVPITALKN